MVLLNSRVNKKTDFKKLMQLHNIDCTLILNSYTIQCDDCKMVVYRFFIHKGDFTI